MAYVGRVRAAVRNTIEEEHPPRKVAGSFALGAFITMLPTLGVGLLVFVVLASVFDSISKVGLFASVVVFNPVVKWGVYAASFALGVLLLGPVDGVSAADVSLQAGPEILVRLLVGNLILAILATVVSYLAVYRITVAYRRSELGELIGETVEELIDDIDEPEDV